MNEIREAPHADLLNAAIELFGRSGFEGASTRAIASACDKPMSAITYHFGGKQGLYLACARHIAEILGERIQPVVEGIDALDALSATREEIEAALIPLVEAGVAIVTDPRLDTVAMFMLREQAAPTEAFDLLYERVMCPLLTSIAGLLAAAANPPIEPERARVLAIMLMGQILMFRTCRATTMRFSEWEEIGADQKRQLVGAARVHLSAILHSLSSGEHA